MIYYVPLWFHCSLGLFIPIFCLYSHNSVNFVIGISSMRLNEGSIQRSSGDFNENQPKEGRKIFHFFNFVSWYQNN